MEETSQCCRRRRKKVGGGVAICEITQSEQNVTNKQSGWREKGGDKANETGSTLGRTKQVEKSRRTREDQAEVRSTGRLCVDIVWSHIIITI